VVRWWHFGVNTGDSGGIVFVCAARRTCFKVGTTDDELSAKQEGLDADVASGLGFGWGGLGAGVDKDFGFIWQTLCKKESFLFALCLFFFLSHLQQN
jgi:hypothetical protein